MNKRFSTVIFSIFFSIFLVISGYPEGSKNLTPAFFGPANGLNTWVGYLEHDFDNDPATYGFDSGSFLGIEASEDERVYIRILPGETLYFGLRRTLAAAVLQNDADYQDLHILLFENDETEVGRWTIEGSGSSALDQANQGVIDDYASALAGPQQVVGGAGYDALEYTNTTGQSQDFYVVFIQNDTAPPASPTVVDDIDVRSWYDIWDFSVFNGTEEKPGRMFCQRWNFSGGAFDAQFSTDFQLFVRIPSEIGEIPSGSYIKELDMQGMEPFSVNVYANSLGADPGQVAGDFTAQRQSQDTEYALLEYDIFLNNPDADAYPTTILPTVEISDAIFDCNGLNGEAILNFETNQIGQVAIILDLNGVSGYQAGTTDVIIEDEITAVGSSAISWDGLDGLGAPVASGTQINIRGRFTSGPLHVPFWDAEGNQQGIGMRDVRPATSFDLIYWDDSGPADPGSNPESQLTGTSVNTHTWGAGNNIYTNTWSFGYYQVNSQIILFEYDCDIDGDGLANDLDDDGDNDGISDEQEGDYKADTDLDGIPDYLDPDFAGFVDSNSDGVNDNFDTDLDGVPDGLDLDSDNDGITDFTEARLGGSTTGNGGAVEDDFFVSNPDEILGEQDGNPSQYLGFGSYIVVELENTLSTGQNIEVGVGAQGGDVEFTISFSSDAINFGFPTIYPLSDGAIESPLFSVDVASTRYVRIEQTQGPGQLFVDYIQYTFDNSLGGGSAPFDLPDTDSDGILNFQDTDSDNDGIVDAFEAGGEAGSNGQISNFLDIDGNGRNDVQDIGALPIPDTDADGTLPNYLDLDSDNDGIIDNVEAQASSNHNDTAVGDSDNDGLLNVYDPDNGGTLLIPVDTDGDEDDDYLDTDSDDDGVEDLIEGHDADHDGFGDWDATGSNNDITDESGYATDTDEDGLRNFFESGIGTPAPVQNTDGADLADWQDADDDNDGIPTLGEDSNGNANWTDDFGQGGVGTPNYLYRGDYDGDGVTDLADLDADNDGILDADEDGGESVSPDADADLDGIPNYRDISDAGVTGVITAIDSNTDGVWDNYDADLDGIPDFLDLDSDGDGILDAIEANDGAVPTGLNVATGQFVLNDPDGDGLMNAVDNSPADPVAGNSILSLADTDADGLLDFLDIDSDGDGLPDFTESLSVSSELILSEVDGNGNGLAGAFDPTEDGGLLIIPVNTDGADNFDYLDTDSDNDGVSDLIEGHDGDQNGVGLWDVNTDGIGDELSPIEDADGDGLDDAFDTVALGAEENATGTNAAMQNTDGSGGADYRDTDDDNDGTNTEDEDNNGDSNWANDFVEGGITIPDYLYFGDFDGDGEPDLTDPDSDNDGISDVSESNGESIEPGADADDDNIPNYRDADLVGLADNSDSNSDGIYDVFDTDLDGIPDFRDADSDNDGIADIIEAGGVDANGDGIADDLTDTDEDGLLDLFDTDDGGSPLPMADHDTDGIRDAADVDSDNDGLPDLSELGGSDTDNNGRVDSFVDSNGNGFADTYEVANGGASLIFTDFDGDLVFDHFDVDSDNDGITDAVEYGGNDTDGNGRIDGYETDTDGDGLADAVDLDSGGTPIRLRSTDDDSNIDSHDLDSDNDGYPDILEAGGTDANNDGILDPLEDSDGDGIPNTVDVTETVGTDTTPTDGIDDTYNEIDVLANGIPDNVDFSVIGGTDADADLIEDTYDITYTFGNDMDGDGIDDAFDSDRDGDGIINGSDPDANGDGLDDLTANDPLFIQDFDGDGLSDYIDIDADGDGLVDVLEFNETPSAIGTIASPITDVDVNGWNDTQDGNRDDTPVATPNTDFATDPADYPNYLDLDSDDDGIVDNIEAQASATYIAPSGNDINNNGLDDAYDPAYASLLAAVNTDGVDNPDYIDGDSDNDTVADLIEGNNTNRAQYADWDANTNGVFDDLGYDADTDDDGILDIFDTTEDDQEQAIGSNASVQDTDGDGVRDWQDIDDDNDAENTVDEDDDTTNGDPTDDFADGGVTIPDYLYNPLNSDMDAILDIADIDADNDGLANEDEDGGSGLNPGGDIDADGLLNYLDTDMDDDGLSNEIDGDADGDTNADTFSKADINADGIFDVFDKDLDGVPDFLDRDSDNDGIMDIIELGVLDLAFGFTDTDSNGEIDLATITDVDADGMDDNIEPGAAPVLPLDSDSDGIFNYLDLDSDNDGITDNREGQSTVAYRTPLDLDSDSDGILDAYDVDGDGAITPENTDSPADAVPDYLDTDSDNDGVADYIEAFDIDQNGFTDLDTDDDNLISDEFGYLADTDRDGILNIFDTNASGFSSIANVSGSNQVLQDTDGDLERDYRDTDDDGDLILTSAEDATDGGAGGSDGIWTNDFAQGGITIPDYLYTPDFDGDGILNNSDDDGDDDGIEDIDEYPVSALNPYADADGDNIYNYLDPGSDVSLVDVNGDGVSDLYDNDLDGIPNFFDVDSDNDGIYDAVELLSGDNPLNQTPNFDLNTGRFTGTETNGFKDAAAGLFVAVDDTDTDNWSDHLDLDSDNDGIPDNIEAQSTVGFIAPVLADTDGDGLADVYDPTNGGTVLIPVNTDVADAPDYLDTDSDNDGVVDLIEGHDANANGYADWDNDNDNDPSDITDYDTDLDGDGVFAVFDNYSGSGLNNVNGTVAKLQDTDLDNTLDFRDNDDDDDGTVTGTGAAASGEDFNGDGNWANDVTQGGSAVPDYLFAEDDTDDDGVADASDLDGDNDGILNSDEDQSGLGIDPLGDEDNDGVFNYRDLSDGAFTATDSNGDGIVDEYDADLDGVPNFFDLDSDNDGIPDLIEAGGTDTDSDGELDSFTDVNEDGYEDNLVGTPLPLTNTDGTGPADFLDLDSDNDAIPDIIEAGGTDNNNNGQVDTPGDSDGDGFFNLFDPDNSGEALDSPNTDGDNLEDRRDLDSDNDGIPDIVEAGGTTGYAGDDNGLVDVATDTNGNGWADAHEGAGAPSADDLDGDGLMNTQDLDSDNDGIPDAVEGSDGINLPANMDENGQYPTAYANANDANSNGLVNAVDGAGLGFAIPASDADGLPNFLDLNSDGQGLEDCIEALDDDEDDNALPDYETRAANYETANTTPGHYTTSDSDGDDVPNWLEDSDGDGRPNFLDPDNSTYYRDTDSDGIVDLFDPESNGVRVGAGGMPDNNDNGIPNFMDNTDDVALPVELRFFGGVYQDRQVVLNWQTASELNNSLFIIEKSSDAEEFTGIGEVQGNGTSSEQQSYSYIDSNPVNGINYYRLVQVDFDGALELSKTIAVVAELEKLVIEIFPNPTSDQFSIRLSRTVHDLTLMLNDISGSLIFARKITGSNERGITINVSGLKEGVYVLSLNSDGDLESHKLVIDR